MSQTSPKLACVASVAAASCWAPTERSTAPTPPELELEGSPVPTRLNHQMRKTLESRRELETAEEEGEEEEAETGAEGRRRGTGSRDSSLDSSCSNESIGGCSVCRGSFRQDVHSNNWFTGTPPTL